MRFEVCTFMALNHTLKIIRVQHKNVLTMYCAEFILSGMENELRQKPVMTCTSPLCDFHCGMNHRCPDCGKLIETWECQCLAPLTPTGENEAVGAYMRRTTPISFADFLKRAKEESCR